MFWIFLSGLLTGLAFRPCAAQQATGSKFSCDGRGSGYYADVASGCQVYHMCDGLGRQFSYTCPNATLFQQRMLICDHWYMVNCSRSEDDYSANLLIGQKKPFVEDTGSNPFHRTPRPDLLTHPSSESEYNIIYRTGKEQHRTRTNIVGAEQENDQSGDSDEPTYFPPSHWSTAYSSQITTVRPLRDNNENRRILNQGSKTNFSAGKKTRGKPKAINFDSSNRNGNNFENSPKYKNEGKYNAAPTVAPVSYKSNFKATTPVFPSRVEESSEPPNDVGILPPIPYRTKTKSSNSQTDPPQVYYKSSFEATTPVFPLTVEDSSSAPNDIGILPPIQKTGEARNKAQRRPQVNFQSNFKATTPVFPLTVEEASEAPNEIGIQPPEKNDTTENAQPQVNFKSNFEATTPVFPLTVDEASEAPGDIGILPPDLKQNAKDRNNINAQSEAPVNFKSDFKATTPVFPVTGDDSSVAPSDLGIQPPENEQVNFKSNFKATTPVYPKFVEPKDKVEISNVPLQKEAHVNFYSDFKATTPVYPKSVESTSPDPGEVGLVPPQSNDTKTQGTEDSPSSNDIPDLLLSLAPPEFDPNYGKTHENVETTPVEPSVFYQAPKFEPDYTEPESKSNVKLGIEIENIMKSLSKEQWQNIRQRFHIPEYEFPLDDATRPSYDSIANSFANKR